MRRPNSQSSPDAEPDWEAIAATEITPQTPPWKRWKIETARNHLEYQQTKTRLDEFWDAYRRGVPLPPGDPIPEVYLPIGWTNEDAEAMNRADRSGHNTLDRASDTRGDSQPVRPVHSDDDGQGSFKM